MNGLAMTRPTPIPLADQLVGNPADAIELRDRDHLFVRGDLEDAVGGRVDDRVTGPHVLGAELVDDRRPRRGVVADRAAADAFLELGDHFRGEAVGKRGERPIQHDTGHLPMTGDGILPRRSFGHPSVGAERRVDWRHPLHVGDARQSERTQRGERQWHETRDVAERIAAAIAVRIRVGQLADAHAVEHGQEDAIWRGCHKRRAAASSMASRSPAA
jgi:hypothetical protein